MSDVINELILRTRKRYEVTSVVVTHDMHSAKKIADRIIMLYPYSRLKPGESQILFDGPPSELEFTRDRRVKQFVLGEAGERLMEMLGQQGRGGLGFPQSTRFSSITPEPRERLKSWKKTTIDLASES